MSKSIQGVLTLCLLVGPMQMAWSQTEGHEHHHTMPAMSEAPSEPAEYHGHSSAADESAPASMGNMDHHDMHEPSAQAPMMRRGAGHMAGHGKHDGAEEAPPAYTQPRFPQPTAAERQAAFPDLGGMDLRRHMRTPLLGHLLVDQLEWQDADEGAGGAWDVTGWLGYDFNRLWLRSEGEREGGEFEAAEAHLLYGRAIARWWDLVAGLRQDFEPGPGRTYAALGLQGLSPYWFETELTLYAGERGQSGARLEFEYEQLLTNRLILQPRIEFNAWSRSDTRRGIGAGLADLEAGLRLRYEIRREFAPYIGVNYAQVFGNTADLRKARGDDTSELRAVAGLRLWF